MLKRVIKVALGILLLLALLQTSSIPPYRAFDYGVGAVVTGHQFSFARWEAGAITRKLDQMVTSTAGGLSEEEKKAVVLDYLSLIQEIGQLEGSIQQTYSTVEGDPAAATLPLRQELEDLRQRQTEEQGQVEAILEEQITQILLSQDLDTLGIVWPPVKFQFERLPLYLVVSPRQEIRVKKGIYLEHGLGLDLREAIEGRLTRLSTYRR